MKILISVICVFVLFTSSFATPVHHPSGPNLTYGAISNSQNIMSDITNPAAGAAVFTKSNGQIRFGVLSSVGAGYEMGGVVDMVTEVDNMIKFFTNGINETNTQIRPVDPGLTTSQNVANVLADVNALITNTNTIMADLQKDGYFKSFSTIHAPVMPLIVSHEAFAGSFVFDINQSIETLATFISDDIDQLVQTTALRLQVIAAEGGLELNLGDVIASDTAIIVKGTNVTELSLGYSISNWQSNAGQLFTGIRTNFYKVALTRSAQLVDSSTDESLKSIRDDNKESNLVDSSGFGIDLGILWVSEHYRLGATVKNINHPHFHFEPVDTSAITNSVIIEKLEKTLVYEMNSQFSLEGAFFSSDQNWVFGVAVDTNAIEDPVGQMYQWATVSTAYATDNYVIPGFRVGYRANLAGSQLSYITAGLTFFNVFNLDVAYGIEEIKIEKNDLTSVEGTEPRSIIINIGLEVTF